MFQPINKYFKTIAGVGSGEYLYFWECKGLPNERVNRIKTSNYSITLELSYHGDKIRVKFNGSCLKEDKITYTHGRIVNIYIVYEITENYNISNYPTLENRLFGAVSLTKHTDIDHCKYSGYGIGFSRNDEFSFDNGYGKNIIIFGVDTSNYSIHTNKIRSHLILGEDLRRDWLVQQFM